MHLIVYLVVMLRFLLVLATILSIAQSALTEDAPDIKRLLKNGSLRVERSDGTPLLQYRDTSPFVPASVLKVATAFCALEELGTNFRFETLFFTDNSTLFIRGSGDPSLVSETLDSVASQLVSHIKKIDYIIIDTSFFADNINIDGSERSLNPYDAKNAAFVGNYSSAAVTHSQRGEIISAEPQTPLTPLSRQAAMRLPRGKTERVNLSPHWKIGVQYGGELLAAFLKKHGARGEMKISLGSIPDTAKLALNYRSPHSLKEMTKGMLEYSTNFTANQLFLVLGTIKYGAPATVAKGQRSMRQCLEERIGWRDFHVEEGSGLSRRNRVTSSQMTDLLKSFTRYSFLLPEKHGFLAKTGSLRGVNSLAGYLDLGDPAGPARFCILINSEVPHLYKFHVAREIRDYLRRSGRPVINRPLHD